jgi:transcriptional regulator with XRE-family HTH domain
MRNPTVVVLNKIAKALDVDLSTLFEGIREL